MPAGRYVPAYISYRECGVAGVNQLKKSFLKF